MRIRVFVKFDTNYKQEVLDSLANAGFVLKYQSRTDESIIIGTIEKDKIEDLINNPFIINVWENTTYGSF